MNYHFVSDDRFFLQGVSGIDFRHRGNVFLHHPDTLPAKKRPGYGDIVVVNIADIAMRKKILRLPELIFCRLIILLRIKNLGLYQAQGKFPWLMPDNICQRTLAYTLVRAATTTLVQQRIPEPERRLFHYLGCGHSFSALGRKMHLTTKYLYSLKLRTMKRYGLRGGHAAGVLLCRDVTGIPGLSAEFSFCKGYQSPAESLPV